MTDKMPSTATARPIGWTHSGFSHRLLRYGPSVAALLYPLALAAVHGSAEALKTATLPAGAAVAGLLLVCALAFVYGVPAVSFLAIVRSKEDISARRLAHLAFAAPPTFVLLGVLAVMLGLPGGDYAAWLVMWSCALFYARQGRAMQQPPMPAPVWIRFAQGISAALIIAVFLGWHLLDHLVAVWSFDANTKVTDALRVWYRSALIQPALVALFGLQLVTGLRLLWTKIARDTDLYASVQTATGAYLAIYVMSHLNSVFVYARLIEQAAVLLRTGGCLVLEMGFGAADHVRHMLEGERDWVNVSVTNDLAGIPRVVAAERARRG